MGTENVVNTRLAELLNNHGVQTQLDDEFVLTNLPGDMKFKARVFYH